MVSSAYEPEVYKAALGFSRDPFPKLAMMREQAAVCPVLFPDGLGIVRWVITRYDDVVNALSDTRLSNNLGRGIPGMLQDGDPSVSLRAQIRAYEVLGKAVGNTDPPEHARLRKLLIPAFAARKIDRLRSRVAELTGKLLDAVGDRNEFDLMDALAMRLPILVVCELLGVPEEGAELCRAAATVLGGSMHDEQTALRAIESLDAFAEYAGQLIEAKRNREDADLISDLIRSEVDGERLTPDELVATCGFLLFAGHRTTVQLIGNGMLALLTNPGQQARLRADPSLLPNAVEEFLRYDGPVNPGVTRYALADVEVGGVTIPRGSYVMVATAAANRDPAVWEAPDELRVDRDFRHQQLAFGHGLHYCLGARLAHAECEIAIGALLSRYPRIDLAVPCDQLRWEEGFGRCLLELPLRVHGGAASPC